MNQDYRFLPYLLKFKFFSDSIILKNVHREIFVKLLRRNRTGKAEIEVNIKNKRNQLYHKVNY